MSYKKTMFALAIGSVGIMGSVSAQATEGGFDFLAGNRTTLAGSWFSMLAADTDEDLIPDANVYTMLRGAGTSGTNPVTAGGTLNFGQVEGHTGTTGSIDKAWSFFSASGIHYTNQALEVTVTGNTGTVNMDGWTVYWNGGDIDMGAGADAVVNNVDGIWGNGNDTLDYSAVVPSGGFAGVQYSLHLQGCMPSLDSEYTECQVATIPEASTYAMMLAGLGLVGVATRRRK